MLVACLAHPWGTATPPLPVVGVNEAKLSSTGFQPNEEEGVSRMQECGVVDYPKEQRRPTSWSRRAGS